MITAREFYKYFDTHPMGKVHLESKQALLELNFISDDRHFFDELFHTYSFQLIVNEDFARNKDILSDWSDLHKANKELIESVNTHDNKIEILLKNKQNITEVKYALWHKTLMKDIEDHLAKYKELKQAIFDIIKGFMKKEKLEQKHLLDK